ncbi:MAG TPA: universal stress protein, partial [Blastocatellia bacterium]|nr:universal stress protein [Blastocatellia bacterium]
MTPGTILLATDLSCRCDRALDRATMLAAEWKARLVVLHVLEHPVPGTDAPSWRRPPDPLQAARRQVLGDIRGAEGVEVDVLVERGEPAEVILNVIERHGCDLVLTGVARYETLGRALLGTTVETLTRKANVPVLVVKARPRGPYRKVVVATDFSEGSRYALETALALLPEAELSIFHAYTVPYEQFVDNRMSAREAMEQKAMADSQAFLAATPAVAASGRPVAALYEY